MRHGKALLLVLAATIAVSGCTQSPGSDADRTGPEPYRVPVAEVTVEAEVLSVETRDVRDTGPGGRETFSPDDSVTLEIRSIKSVENPEDVEHGLEEGDRLTLGTRYGARPVQIIELPAEAEAQGSDSAVSLSKWSEREDGGFVFYRKSETFETRRVAMSLPGLEEGDLVETTLVRPKNGELQPLGEYKVLG